MRVIPRFEGRPLSGVTVPIGEDIIIDVGWSTPEWGLPRYPRQYWRPAHEKDWEMGELLDFLDRCAMAFHLRVVDSSTRIYPMASIVDVQNALVWGLLNVA